MRFFQGPVRLWAKYFVSFLRVQHRVLLSAEGFAPAGATKGLSDRPLETFGPQA